MTSTTTPTVKANIPALVDYAREHGIALPPGYRHRTTEERIAYDEALMRGIEEARERLDGDPVGYANLSRARDQLARRLVYRASYAARKAAREAARKGEAK